MSVSPMTKTIFSRLVKVVNLSECPTNRKSGFPALTGQLCDDAKLKLPVNDLFWTNHLQDRPTKNAILLLHVLRI